MERFPPAALAHTEALCAERAECARTRDQLLAFERDAHRAGWDSEEAAPTVFNIASHPERGVEQLNKDVMFTGMLYAACARSGGNAGDALQLLAYVVERTRDTMTGMGMADQTDMLSALSGNINLVGIGFRTEAWVVGTQCADDATVNAMLDAAEQGRLGALAQSMEIRYLQYVGRDGITWALMRRRGHVPEIVAAKPGDSQWEFGGLVANALARMVNAMGPADIQVPGTAMAIVNPNMN